jgi:lipoprotein-releasing system permease protein
LYDLGDSVHDLEVMLKDPYSATEVKWQLEQTLGDEFVAYTWMEQNSTILNALIVEKNVMFYLLFFIVLVAALCILSAQITFVVQKTREIGMLKALGATNLQISGVFLSQSAIIGVLGVLAGYGLGILALTYRNGFLHFMNHLTGWELFPASIYGFSELPAIIDTRDIALICGSSFVICILGGVLPAWRAGRLKPVEALRYE